MTDAVRYACSLCGGVIARGDRDPAPTARCPWCGCQPPSWLPEAEGEGERRWRVAVAWDLNPGVWWHPKVRAGSRQEAVEAAFKQVVEEQGVEQQHLGTLGAEPLPEAEGEG